MIGRTVNRYKIVAKIGEGGMGTVWKAEDPLLERTIALKFLPESLSTSADARRRLLREARSASTLNHPGIATVYDAGEEDGQVYLAMLFVDGGTVAERIARGPVPISEATRIARESCEALGHAHSQGVLHRDITARNIMTAEDGHVVVVDFGLALPEGASRLTRSGLAVGTTAYLAPEVLTGNASDQRSDIYGLGVVLYEMLTGRLPFEAERQEALSYLAVHEDAKAPSEHNAGIDLELDRVVLKALAKDPKERYQTAREFEADLRAFRGEPPRAEMEEETAARVGARSRRRRLVSQVSRVLVPQRPMSWLVLTLILIAAAGALWKTGVLRFGGSQRFASVAVLPLVNESDSPGESAWLATGISQTLVTKLTQLSDLRVIPWRTSQGFSDASMSIPEIAKALRVDALIVGSMRQLGDRVRGSVSLVDASGQSQYWADEFEELVEDMFAVQTKIALGLANSIKGNLSGSEETEMARAPAENWDAYEYYLKGSKALQIEGEETSNQALALFEKAVERDPKLAPAYVGIGAIHSDRFFYGWGGLESLETAEANYRTALMLSPGSTDARRGLIRVFWEKGLDEESLKQGKAVALEGREDIEGLLVRADAYFMSGQPDRAIPFYERIIDMDPENRAAHWFLVIAHTWAGQFERGITAGEAFFEKFGEEAEIHNWVGVCYERMGDLDAARIHAERSLVFSGERGGLFLASLYIKIGAEEKARKVLLDKIETTRKKLELHPDNFRMLTRLILSYARLRDHEMLWREEQKLLDLTETGPLGEVALAHLEIDEAERAFELLGLAAQKGTDNLFAVAHLGPWGGANPVDIEQQPGYEDCMKELKKLNDRLRAQY
ncbi:MAG: protein kinase [Candidatus Krumholzibacteria bacterium]